MTLLDTTREWVAVRASEVKPGDVLVRAGRPGPVVHRVVACAGGWVAFDFAGAGSSPPMRPITPLVVERTTDA